MKDFTRKNILITGGSSGIGLALAKLLAARGADICILARRKQPLEDARLEILKFARDTGQKVFTIAADISSPAGARASIQKYIKEEGAPDLLINSAGVVYPGEFEKLPDETFQTMISINYLGTVYVTRAVLQHMLKNGNGYIVNICSAGGFFPAYGYSAYAGSKYALRGFTDVLKQEMRPVGIKVSIVFPPDTDTPQLEFEKPLRPHVTQALADTNGVMSAEAVAAAIIRGIEKEHYMIIPSRETRFLYWLSNFLGPRTYNVLDFLVARALKKSPPGKENRS